MKLKKITIGTLSLLISCSSIVFANTDENSKNEIKKPTPLPKEENLLFYDDFSGSALDSTKWDLARQSNANWTRFLSDDPSGIEVKNSNLYLRAIWDHSKGGNPITWGIKSENKFSFSYGEIYVRAKFTKSGDGAWPAIWLMPQNQVFKDWPYCGEIDIMERIDNDPILYHAYHITDKSGEARVGNNIVDFEGYNIYGLKKYPDRLEYYVNGINTYTLHKDEILASIWPFDTDWYIILNHACADDGDWGLTWWPRLVTEPYKLPYEMAVDWVRVYKFD